VAGGPLWGGDSEEHGVVATVDTLPQASSTSTGLGLPLV
jgi:hypothetical protein